MFKLVSLHCTANNTGQDIHICVTERRTKNSAGSDCIDSYFDALSTDCSLSALWVLSVCSLSALLTPSCQFHTFLLVKVTIPFECICLCVQWAYRHTHTLCNFFSSTWTQGVTMSVQHKVYVSTQSSSFELREQLDLWYNYVKLHEIIL